MASAASATPHRVPLVAHLPPISPPTMAPSPPSAFMLCDTAARAAKIPSVPFCTILCTSSPAKLDVPEAVGEGVTRVEEVKGWVAASTLMVGVGGEEGKAVVVVTFELVPMDRVADAERDLVGAKDRVESADKEKWVVGLAVDVGLCLAEGLVAATVLVEQPVGIEVLDAENEPATILVGVPR
jgi:hypothetical protein